MFDKPLTKDYSMKECCNKCGFPVDMPRNIVFLDNNIFSIIHWMNNHCESCGHQIDGSTIKVVQEHLESMARRFIREREELLRFVKEYKVLNESERKKVCTTLSEYEEGEEIEIPYSWNVVWIEVINNTSLGKTLLASINWEDGGV